MLQVRVLPARHDVAIARTHGVELSKIESAVVGVAQLVEPRVVIPVVVGSSPIVHPNFLE